MSSPPLFFSCRPWQETVPILLISSWHQLYFIDLYSFFVVVVCFVFISSYSLFPLLWIYFSLLLDSWDVILGEWSEAFPLSLYPVSAMNFFLSAALTLSHKFWYVVLLFSFSLTWYLIFLRFFLLVLYYLEVSCLSLQLFLENFLLLFC